MVKKAKKSANVVAAPEEDSKICSSCGYQKSLAEFPKVGAICKACKKIYHKQWRDKAYARICSQCGKTRQPSDMQPQQHPDICKRCFQKRKSKRCRKCGEVKPLTLEFWHEAPESADGFRGECLDCRACYDAAKYMKQRLDPQYRERKSRNSKEWYAEHREYVSEREKQERAKPEVQQRRRKRDAHRRATDPEFVERNKRRSRDWYQANKEHIAEERRLHRAARRLVTPRQKRQTGIVKFANQIGTLKANASLPHKGDGPAS
jgi:hypothetical protein